MKRVQKSVIGQKSHLLQLLHALARGEKAIEEGRVVSNAEAKKRLSRWLK